MTELSPSEEGSTKTKMALGGVRHNLVFGDDGLSSKTALVEVRPNKNRISDVGILATTTTKIVEEAVFSKSGKSQDKKDKIVTHSDISMLKSTDTHGKEIDISEANNIKQKQKIASNSAAEKDKNFSSTTTLDLCEQQKEKSVSNSCLGKMSNTPNFRNEKKVTLSNTATSTQILTNLLEKVDEKKASNAPRTSKPLKSSDGKNESFVKSMLEENANISRPSGRLIVASSNSREVEGAIQSGVQMFPRNVQKATSRQRPSNNLGKTIPPKSKNGVDHGPQSPQNSKSQMVPKKVMVSRPSSDLTGNSSSKEQSQNDPARVMYHRSKSDSASLLQRRNLSYGDEKKNSTLKKRKFSDDILRWVRIEEITDPNSRRRRYKTWFIDGHFEVHESQSLMSLVCAQLALTHADEIVSDSSESLNQDLADVSPTKTLPGRLRENANSSVSVGSKPHNSTSGDGDQASQKPRTEIIEIRPNSKQPVPSMNPAQKSNRSIDVSTSRIKSSTYHGVSWHTQRRRWRSYVYLDVGKQKYLGMFLDQREAAEAYDNAVVAYGLNSPLNFPEKIDVHGTDRETLRRLNANQRVGEMSSNGPMYDTPQGKQVFPGYPMGDFPYPFSPRHHHYGEMLQKQQQLGHLQNFQQHQLLAHREQQERLAHLEHQERLAHLSCSPDGQHHGQMPFHHHHPGQFSPRHNGILSPHLNPASSTLPAYLPQANQAPIMHSHHQQLQQSAYNRYIHIEGTNLEQVGPRRLP